MVTVAAAAEKQQFAVNCENQISDALTDRKHPVGCE